MALTGSEVLQVLGVQTNGFPAATTQQVTTAQVASVSGGTSSTTTITALTTVGAGTITAAGIYGKITSRGGTQIAAFTDTTATAAAIVALLPAGTSTAIGTSFVYRYINNTVFPATITGGVGVTVSGITVIPANAWAEYLLTYTAANTFTMVGFEQGFFPHMGTFVNNGTSTVTTADTNMTAGSQVLITLKTVGGTVGAIPHLLTTTPQTGFATVGTASDTSTYNYIILG